MHASTRALLTGIADYAGTFPPAGLSLVETVANYDRIWKSADRWLLGRLIVPGASLREFDELTASQGVGSGWNVSVVMGRAPEAHLVDALSFAERPTTPYRIASLEFPPLGAASIRDLSRSVPSTIETYFEVQIDGDLARCINVIASAGALAKVRTGGVTAGAFPTPEGLVHFIEVCADAGIAFKATAGLHHAIRGCYPLTYEPTSESAQMHGFLNVAMAAATIYTSGSRSEALNTLRLAAETCEFGETGLTCSGRTIPISDLAATRRVFFRSFGSCSLREPLDDLNRLRIV